MRLAHALLPTLVLFGLAGCGYVAGNYPVPKTPPPALPETHTYEGDPAPLVWNRAPELVGFFTEWADLQEMAAMLRTAADAGDRRAEQELEFVEGLREQNLAAFVLHVFLDRGAERRLAVGRLNMEFADGGSTRDVGAVFYEQQRRPPRRRSTLDGTQTLKSEYAEPGEPLELVVLVPGEYAGRTITLIRLF